MYRAFSIALATASLLTAGCRTTWDTVTSRSFRDAPFKTISNTIVPEDPLVVLRADPPRPGDQQAKAMRRLKEPLHAGGSQQEQDEILEILNRAATGDSSPVVRYAAIEALGRFEDPRTVAILMTAYQKAHGQSEAEIPAPGKDHKVVPIGGLSAGRAPVQSGGLEANILRGPSGFSPDTTAALRCRCLESLGQTNTAHAAQFLASVAEADGTAAPPGSDDPEVRQAAVRGLGKCRQPEAVAALATVLSNEAAKDPTLARGAHQGLVRLTGKKLPPDPQQWNEVVQAGVTIAPAPTWLETAIQSAAFWEK